MSMIDPKLFQEVCGVSPLLPPLTPFGPSLASGRSLPWGSFLSRLEVQTPETPRNLCRQGPNPHCSQGSQRLVPVPSPCRLLHPAPCPCPQDPLGQPPSLCSSQRSWRQAACSFSSGLTLHRNPRSLLPLFLMCSEIDSLLAENPEAGPQPSLSTKICSPYSSQGPPAEPTAPATPHRPRQGDPQHHFPSETQSPG